MEWRREERGRGDGVGGDGGVVRSVRTTLTDVYNSASFDNGDCQLAEAVHDFKEESEDIIRHFFSPQYSSKWLW